MTPEEHKSVFLKFLKSYDYLNHLTFSASRVEDQKIIGFKIEERESDPFYYQPEIDELLKSEDNIFININYDELIYSFQKIDYDLETVEYVKNLVDSISEEKIYSETADVIIDWVLNPLINENINAKNVYVVITPNWPNLDFFDDVVVAK